MGNNANASTENSISANTARSSCSREARTTAAEMAALIDSTDVNLFLRINASPRGKKKKECAPLALDRGGVVRVVGKSGVHQKEGRCERPDRVGRRGGCESTEDGCEGYECKEGEQGCLDCACT